MIQQLKLFNPADLLPPPSAEVDQGAVTLDAFYRAAVRPVLERKGLTPGRLTEYDLAVRRWLECREDYRREYRISNPVLAQLKTWDFAAFQNWLLMRGVGGRTVNKHLGDLRSILRRCETVGRIPAVDAVPTRRAAPKLVFSLDDLAVIYRACAAADWPTINAAGEPLDYSPATGWRAALAVWSTYGLRTQELIATCGRFAGLAWSNLTGNAPNPTPGGLTSCARGWLVYTPQKQKRFKPEPLALPITPAVRHNLDAIGFARLAGKPAAAVFDWPRSRRAFYRTWRAILRAAGVEPIKLADGKTAELNPKHLRKTAETLVDQIDPGVGPMVVGHAPRELAYRNYISTETRIAAALDRLALPAVFLET